MRCKDSVFLSKKKKISKKLNNKISKCAQNAGSSQPRQP